MPKFHLVLLIHSHQPVGNFDAVFEHVYQRSYLPFVEHLERHPKVRLGLHYTGPLLEWFAGQHPEFLERLRGMAARRQVEMVGGGFYEPILVSIAREDRAEQIRRMSDYLAKEFGEAPAGAWVAERVWEPQLPSTLAAAGVAYTLVDDVHFQSAGLELDELHGDYICEDGGRTVRVFPGLKALRYLLPFGTPEQGMDFLRESASRHPGGMAAMGDDCEKFGAWPSTYEHCYRDGWLERFFTALEGAEEWLVTTPPGDYAATHAPLGRADLPTASYSEMMEWVLPTPARDAFHAVGAEFASRPDVQRFLRGGHWRGFFSKYAEGNLLHKKMLRVSERLRGAGKQRLSERKRAKLRQARTHVLRAQCNDAYWHGVFGGLYAPHLRTALWRELVRAETLADEIAARGADGWRFEPGDFDADGKADVYVSSRRAAALVSPSDGGTLAALDFRPTGVTLINSMQRRRESYHARLSHTAQGAPEQAVSIHDQVRAKEGGLEELLRYDRWPRNCFRMLLFAKDKTFENYRQLALEEHAAFAGGPYAVREAGPERVVLACEAASAENGPRVRCTKQLTFANAGAGVRVTCAVELQSAEGAAMDARAGLELVLNLLAPDAPDRYFEIGAQRHALRWAGAVQAADAARLRMVDEWQGVAITIEAAGASGFWIAPIETVSESEEGFERVYQGSQIVALWPATIAAGAAWRGEVTLHVEPAQGEPAQ